MANQKLISFKDESIILHENSNIYVMYKILMGKVLLYLNYDQPEEYLVGVRKEEDCIGAFGLLTGKPNPYTIKAFGDVVLMPITQDEFEDFLMHNHRNTINIMKSLADLLDLSNANIRMVQSELVDMAEQNKQAEKIMLQVKKIVKNSYATAAMENGLYVNKKV